MKTTSLITLFYLFNSTEASKLNHHVKLAQTMVDGAAALTPEEIAS